MNNAKFQSRLFRSNSFGIPIVLLSLRSVIACFSLVVSGLIHHIQTTTTIATITIPTSVGAADAEAVAFATTVIVFITEAANNTTDVVLYGLLCIKK